MFLRRALTVIVDEPSRQENCALETRFPGHALQLLAANSTNATA
jgi:hypothetical protein